MNSRRIVFLDADTLVATRVRPPNFPHEWVNHPQTSPDQVVERLRGATICLSNKVPVREAALAELPDLKMIAVAATGTDNIDLPACRARGIAVANIRGYATAAVPEHVFALILALKRNLIPYHEAMQRGEWQRHEQFCLRPYSITDLRGATLGLVGFGSLAQGTARIGRHGFGMRVVFAAHRDKSFEDYEVAPLDTLVRESDVLSLHCPLRPETRGFIGAEQLRHMKRSAILINTARGGLVDETALAEALRAGVIAGAGFDVLTAEPPRAGNVLLDPSLPNFLLTPHTAWASDTAMQALADQLVENIEAWVGGREQNRVV